jgi:hypothetical protein
MTGELAKKARSTALDNGETAASKDIEISIVWNSKGRKQYPPGRN